MICFKSLLCSLALLAPVVMPAVMQAPSMAPSTYAHGSVAVASETGLALDWIAALEPVDAGAQARTVRLFLQLRYEQVVVEQRQLVKQVPLDSIGPIEIAATEVDPAVAHALALQLIGLDETDPAAAALAIEAVSAPMLVEITVAPGAGISWGQIADGAQLVVGASHGAVAAEDASALAHERAVPATDARK